MKKMPQCDYLRMLRITAGYSQKTIACLLNIQPASYSHYETAINKTMCNEYLSVLADLYELSVDTLIHLPEVNIDALDVRPPVTPAENLAAFLLYFNDPDIFPLYRNLSYEQKWCIYYFKECAHKKELLSLMSAAPEIIPFFYFR